MYDIYEMDTYDINTIVLYVLFCVVKLLKGHSGSSLHVK